LLNLKGEIVPNYYSIISRVINYIERNLDKEIQPENICEFAGYSQFHFLRIFSSLAGIPLSQYIRQRRLSEAANEIITTNKSIQEIATKFGFSRKEVFSRAFKKNFRTIPSKYRKFNKLIYYTPKLNLSDRQENKKIRGITMNYKITEYPKLHVVGFKIKTSTKDSKENMGKAWQKLISRLPEFPNDDKLLMLGVIFHDPRFTERAPLPEEEWYYMAGIASTEKLEIPEGMVAHSISECKYAVFTTQTTSEEMCKTYKYISVDWPQEVDYEFVPHEEIEFYDDRYKPQDPENSYMDLLIPIN
jgi:AraC family transcriptional regulator